ncbi:T9SS type A sorting domain-containing protein [Tamlana agarivorans]|uniref:T9SS type A sorting domain-containing protein n=1 Tax=Pseudotamlana agarivorans TaxID=481183 RepID=A0ACC5U9I4_9FLAO|nr:T9SS type A sorting domain-containing protein [Tamlana agarivorans]MBU2950979.1 T9SS type A sorting domain-containing protein [Tamlana agarivorans]
MRKIYTLYLFTIAFTAIGTAQETIFDSDFSDGTYTGVPAVEADLDAHADWNAGHFGNTSTWTAFQTGNGEDVVNTGAFYAYAIVDSKPITAIAGDVITIRTVTDYGFSGQSYGTEADEPMIFTGLLDQNAPASGADGNGVHREGVMVVNKGSTNQIALSNNGEGTAFDDASAILTTEDAAHIYEVVIEYTIGTNEGTSSKIARIHSINGTNGSSTSTVSSGISTEVYNALTGSGAYFFNWALRFGFGSSEISRLDLRHLSITKNDALLSTSSKNSFEFSMYPNPVKDRLFINTKETISKVSVLDALGRIVLEASDVNDFLDVSSLKNAIYIVKLSLNNGNVSTKKFIKE